MRDGVSSLQMARRVVTKPGISLHVHIYNGPGLSSISPALISTWKVALLLL